MHMLSERLQILVTPEQRRRLEAEARRRGASVGALVREAIDDRYRGPTREERMQAAAEIRAMTAGPAPSPEELRRLIDSQFDDDVVGRRRASRR